MMLIVKDGKVLASAHRGEIARGEHAEFTLLERKLVGEDLTGVTLYTTLEPCTSRQHPKVPCATRVIQRRIARVVIGMTDPDSRVQGKGVHMLRTAGIDVDFYPNNLQKTVQELNRDFIALTSGSV